jgi:hypothetical protein
MMMSTPVEIIGNVFLIGAAMSLLFSIYNFIVMLAGVKQEKKKIINFLGPFILFIPQLYDDIGNKARLRALLYIVLMVVFVIAVAFTSSRPS